MSQENLVKQRQAVRTVNQAIQKGQLAPASECTCTACGKPAEEYHHANGYEPEYWLDVTPYWHRCHNDLFHRRPQTKASPKHIVAFDLNAELWRRVRVAAAAEEISIKEYVERALVRATELSAPLVAFPLVDKEVPR